MDTTIRAGSPLRQRMIEDMRMRKLEPTTQAGWVIGGAEVYRQALPHAQRRVVAEIAQDLEGDAFMPALGSKWQETAREARTGANGLSFAFVTYERKC